MSKRGPKEIMSELKRKITETDPDYEDVTDRQAKRQRILEQDARESACKKITSIIKKEFQKEISDKEKELQQIDLRLNQARLVMDRLRACVVASYYGRANRNLTTTPSPNISSSKVPPPNIHPAVKKFIGKSPKDATGQPSSSPSTPSTTTAQSLESSKADDVTFMRPPGPQPEQSSDDTSASPRPLVTSSNVFKPVSLPAKSSSTYDDRRARFKIKKKIVVGNVSRYIPVDQREATDMSSHKWMVYVRGQKNDPDISGFVKKVWFFLHHSYKPNDHVEISVPPFHLTRRGWGEFPVRVQLHFVDARNKKVDIIHHLKLDKTFTGLQKLGAETVVEVELERDFFENDDPDNIPHQSLLPSGTQHLFTSSQKLSSSSLSSSPSSPSITKKKMNSGLPSPSSSISSSLSSSREQNKPCEKKRSKVNSKNSNDVGTSIVKENQSALGRDRTSRVVGGLDSCGNAIVDVDTTWIKEEKGDGVEENGWGRDEVDPTHFVDSNQAENTGRMEDAGISSQGDEEFNVTIKHEDLSVEHFGDVNLEVKSVVDGDYVRRDDLSNGRIESGKGRVLGGQNEVGSKGKGQSGSFSCGLGQQRSKVLDPISSGVDSQPSEHSAIRVNQDWVKPSSESTSPKSLLTSSTLEKIKFQQQSKLQSPNNFHHRPQQTTQNISSFNRKPLEQENTSSSLLSSPSSSLLSRPQLVSNQSPISTPGLQKMTVVNMENHPKHKTTVMVNPTLVNEAVNTSPTSGNYPVSLLTSTVMTIGPGTAPINTKPKLPIQRGLSSVKIPTVTPSTISIIAPKTSPSSQFQTAIDPPQYVVQNASSRNEILTQVQPAQRQMVKKISLLTASGSQRTNIDQAQNKIFYLKPSPSPSSTTSGLNCSATSATPSTPKNKKQISLLTGLVVNAKNNQQKLSPNTELNQRPNLQSHPDSLVRIEKPSYQPYTVSILSQHSNNNTQQILTEKGHTISDTGHVIITKATPNSMGNRAVLPPTTLATTSSNYSLLKPSVTPKPSHIVTGTSNTILAQTSAPNVIIAYPNTSLVKKDPNTNTSGNFVMDLPEYQDVMPDVKMSAIGKTKHRSLQQAMANMDTPQDRIWRQYQVLNAYKQNMTEIQKEQQQNLMKKQDTIEGEVDVIPKINPEDYPDLYSLTKAAIRLHPIIQSGVNKLTHPYCAESQDHWISWPVGKRRASEWHRACFTLKYIRDCLNGETTFKGEQLMTTKQLVHWSRLHAFSPQGPIFPTPNPGVKEDSDSSAFALPHLHGQNTPQSFTSTTDLKSKLPSLSPTRLLSNTDMAEVEIVLEEFDPKKVEVKEELTDVEDKSTSELLPLSDGALFVHDWMRKRGIRLVDQDRTDERISANVIYQVTLEFASDILRRAFSLYSQREKPDDDNLTVEDIHASLCSLPVASFCCNSYLGKEEEEELESGESTLSR